MPPRDTPFGSDTLSTACYLAKGLDDPGFRAWAQEHPDWFVAGTWTAAAQPGRPDRGPGAGTPFTPDQAPPGHRRDRASAAVRTTAGTGKPPPPPLDPATISLADFHDVVAKSRQNVVRQIPSDRTGSSMNVRSSETSSADDVETRLGEIVPVAHKNPEGGVPLVLNDGTPVLDRSGEPMLVPPGVDVDRNIRIGRLLSQEWSGARIFNMASLLRPGGPMDYQRTHGSGSSFPIFNDINRSYVAFGNFNYGAVAAAAGLSLDDAEIAAGLANVMGGDRSGPHGTNPATLPYIIQGFQAYHDGLIGPR